MPDMTAAPTSNGPGIIEEERFAEAAVPRSAASVASISRLSFDFTGTNASLAVRAADPAGACAPPSAIASSIPWRSIEDGTKAALEKDEKFAKLVTDRRKECKGASIGSVSDKCEKADKTCKTAHDKCCGCML